MDLPRSSEDLLRLQRTHFYKEIFCDYSPLQKALDFGFRFNIVEHLSLSLPITVPYNIVADWYNLSALEELPESGVKYAQNYILVSFPSNKTGFRSFSYLQQIKNKISLVVAQLF